MKQLSVTNDIEIEYLGGIWPTKILDPKTKEDITKDFLHVLENLRYDWAGDQDFLQVIPDDGSF